MSFYHHKKRRMLKYRWAVPLTAAAAMLAACDQAVATFDPREPLQVDAVAAAFVDGHPIYVVDVQMEAAAQGLVASGESLEIGSEAYDEVLDQLIDQYLLAREAENRDLHTDPNSQHRLHAARERILGNILVETLVAEGVDEAAVRKMYEAQLGLMRFGEEVRLRHIVLETRANADAVLGELSRGGDFAVLAADRSIDDATRMEGGDLGYVQVEGATGDLARVIAETAVGGVSDPFETDLGWHIVKIEDRRPEQPPTMEELRPQIMQYLTLGEIDRALKRLRVKARVDKGEGGRPPTPARPDPVPTPETELAPEPAAQDPSLQEGAPN